MASQINYFTAKLQKTDIGPITLNLNADYTNPLSALLVTPYWNQTGIGVPSPVGFLPTTIALKPTLVTITDGNAAPSYSENIFAINLNGNSGIGNLKAFCGKVLKDSPSITIPFPGSGFSKPNPVIIVAPYWNGGTTSVAYNDVVSGVSKTGFTVTSLNQASNYFVNYLAIDRGATTTSNPGGIQVEANSINKTGTGKLRVYFTQPFTALPVVLLTPCNNGNITVPGSFETVTYTTLEYFEFTSTNYDPDYFVNWVAAAPVVS